MTDIHSSFDRKRDRGAAGPFGWGDEAGADGAGSRGKANEAIPGSAGLRRDDERPIDAGIAKEFR